MSFAPSGFVARATRARTTRKRLLACAQSHTYEPSYPIPAAAKNLPDLCRGTTIYYNIASVPEHLATAPAPSHQLDGDAYVLAISFPNAEEGQIWVRGRFARTKPFMLEARAGKRLYRGIYGTPGITGWNAPMKPRASCVNGIICWGDESKPKVLVIGPFTLPLLIGGGTLVSRGPTALGDVLTDAQELARDRGTEVCCTPVKYGDATVVLSLGRTSTGSFTGAFVVEKGGRKKRYPRLNVPKEASFMALAVSKNFIVTAMSVTKAPPSNLLSTLMGKPAKRDPPTMDLKEGTLLTVLNRNGGGLRSLRVSDVIVSHLLGLTEKGNELVVRGLCLSSKETKQSISLKTVSDAASGDLWASQDLTCVRSDVFEVELSLDDMSEKPETLSSENLKFPCFKDEVMVYAAGRFVDSDMGDSQKRICLIYDTLSSRAGVKALDNSSSSHGTWLTQHGDDRLSGVVMNRDGAYAGVLRTKCCTSPVGGELLLFDTAAIEDGPISVIELDSEKFGLLQGATGGVWADHSMEWSEEDSKPVKSAYEIFDSRGWNDIDSSFSSLGFNQ
ncbi:Carotenoid oxygenase [Gracilaria domingensis]|nr:Carotenoid oxygenase [Gracilaria domingensis]